MYSLIVDTSGTKTFLAIAHEGKLVTNTTLPDTKQSSCLLLPSIESISKGLVFSFIAIGIGPGSFIGTRMGAMVAKALSYGWSLPLIPFSSKLLPDLQHIAHLTHQLYQEGIYPIEIELVYITPKP